MSAHSSVPVACSSMVLQFVWGSELNITAWKATFVYTGTQTLKPGLTSRHACLTSRNGSLCRAQSLARELCSMFFLREFLLAWKDFNNLVSNFSPQVTFQWYWVHWCGVIWEPDSNFCHAYGCRAAEDAINNIDEVIKDYFYRGFQCSAIIASVFSFGR